MPLLLEPSAIRLRGEVESLFFRLPLSLSLSSAIRRRDGPAVDRSFGGAGKASARVDGAWRFHVGGVVVGLLCAEGYPGGQRCGTIRWNGFGHVGLYGCCRQPGPNKIPHSVDSQLTPSGVICRSTSSHLTAFHSFRTSSPRGILPDGFPNSPSRGDLPTPGVPFAADFDLPVAPLADPYPGLKYWKRDV